MKRTQSSSCLNLVSLVSDDALLLVFVIVVVMVRTEILRDAESRSKTKLTVELIVRVLVDHDLASAWTSDPEPGFGAQT